MPRVDTAYPMTMRGPAMALCNRMRTEESAGRVCAQSHNICTSWSNSNYWSCMLVYAAALKVFNGAMPASLDATGTHQPGPVSVGSVKPSASVRRLVQWLLDHRSKDPYPRSHKYWNEEKMNMSIAGHQDGSADE
ncbi:hypothetical protein MGG_15451 [Pyricularia oryzae 70-15]|uniref:Uncharacterized protein n=2 Tax=Pyricularia oryzae TaxID=318829 RepID=G4NK81_PYRO7|nr:uncharacterized protein MGG_15451 [Pyricularia oryzae 70-15]EHA45804.1 hypothetical protein MGG_15451 [Pyricularia oryzae 70-15]